LRANLYPSNVTFTNTTTTAYTVTGAGGIRGTTGLSKTGNGRLTLSNQNSYAGATLVDAGTLTLDYTTIAPLPASNPISIPTGSTLVLSHAGGTFNLANPISGSGTVIVDPSTTTAGNRDFGTGAVTWNTSGFNGTLRLAPTTGTMRIQVDNTADVGSGPVGNCQRRPDTGEHGQPHLPQRHHDCRHRVERSCRLSRSDPGEQSDHLHRDPSLSPVPRNLARSGGTMNITNSIGGGALPSAAATTTMPKPSSITGKRRGI
jgi:autotransporter-associated beta strand protein